MTKPTLPVSGGSYTVSKGGKLTRKKHTKGTGRGRDESPVETPVEPRSETGAGAGSDAEKE